MGIQKGRKVNTTHGGLAAERGQMVEEGKTEHGGWTEGKG